MTPKPKVPLGASKGGPAPGTTVGGVKLVVPSGTTGATKDLYGLGVWGGQNIDITGLPGPLQQQLLAYGKPIATGNDLMSALMATRNTQTISLLQQMLFNSGFYGTTAAGTAVNALSGFMDAATRDALVKAVTMTGQTGSAFGSYLTAASNIGQATNVLNAANQVGKGTLAIEHPNVINSDAALRAAAISLMGRDATPAEYAQFRAFYDNAYTAGQKDQVKAQLAQNAANPNITVTPGQLAQDYATQQNNAPVFPAHGAHGAPGALQAVQANNAAQAAASTQINSITSAADAAQAANPNNTYSYSAPPDPSAAADQFLRQADPGGVQSHDFSNVMDALQGLIVGAARVYGRDTFGANRN